MKNRISSGSSVNYRIAEDATSDPRTGFAVLSGNPVLLGSFFGVASTSGLPGEMINVNLVGIYELKKPNNIAISFGQKLYYDDKQKLLTPADPTLPWVAVASQDAAVTDPLVVARLNGVPVDLPLKPAGPSG
jgi:predicted RecA/RadA family phage recombinase